MKLIQSLQFVASNLCGFDPGLETSHYIQPSNLSSALIHISNKKTEQENDSRLIFFKSSIELSQNMNSEFSLMSNQFVYYLERKKKKTK